MSKRKIGEGHAAAMGRLGVKELRNALNPSRESVADSEIGLFSTLTQGEIAQGRAGPGHGPEEESPKMTLDELRGLAKQKEEERGMERGREKQREIER